MRENYYAWLKNSKTFYFIRQFYYSKKKKNIMIKFVSRQNSLLWRWLLQHRLFAKVYHGTSFIIDSIFFIIALRGFFFFTLLSNSFHAHSGGSFKLLNCSIYGKFSLIIPTFAKAVMISIKLTWIQKWHVDLGLVYTLFWLLTNYRKTCQTYCCISSLTNQSQKTMDLNLWHWSK